MYNSLHPVVSTHNRKQGNSFVAADACLGEVFAVLKVALKMVSGKRYPFSLSLVVLLALATF